jgi:PAS domain S-box-containing protein
VLQYLHSEDLLFCGRIERSVCGVYSVMRNKPKGSLSRRRTTRVTPSESSRGAPVSEDTGPIDERLRQLFDQLQVGIALMDTEAKIQFANKAASEITGLLPKDIVGKTTGQIGLPIVREDGTEVPMELRPVPRALRSRKPVRGEILGFVNPKSRQLKWFYTDAIPQFASDGNVAGVIVTLTDVTERMRNRQELERTNEFNRQILTSVQEGIIVHGRDLRYQLWNPYMERMSGLKPRDVLGKDPRELFPFLDQYGGISAMEKALAGEIVTEMDMPFEISQTGEKGWCDNKYVPLRSESGEIIGVIATVRDVTGRKRHEDELHELSSRLLQLQDEERRRIARDLHDSLAQQLMAASLNLARLRKMRASARAKRAALISETRRMVSDSARQIRSISYLLHPPLLDELGLASAIEEYAEGFSQRTGIRVDIHMQFRGGRPPQEIETALFRILQESLGNIQKHSASETAAISLTSDGPCITLEISDRGRGIPGPALSSYAALPQKLGVGILGMRERMRQLGGRLEISSNGQGTAVRAILPLVSEV